MNFRIGNVNFASDKTVIIAEAGVNHLGDLNLAERLIASASRSGVDIVKFQTYTASKLTTRNAPRFWSWQGEEKVDGTQFDSYSKLDRFGKSDYAELIRICAKNSVEFLSTPFDVDAVEMLFDLGVGGFKIASCDITNKELLVEVARTKLPILLSTGAADIDEIQRALETIENEGNSEIAILHCTLCYPTKDEDVNLSALIDLSAHFPAYLLGLSDHSLGTNTPALAIMLGARVIEKHYTCDKMLPLSADHWLSVDEVEMTELVSKVRQAEKMLGTGKKEILPSELLARENARRSLVAAKRIVEGEVITASSVTAKRPGTGISPFEIDRVLGRRAIQTLEEDTLLTYDVLSR